MGKCKCIKTIKIGTFTYERGKFYNYKVFMKNTESEYYEIANNNISLRAFEIIFININKLREEKLNTILQ